MMGNLLEKSGSGESKVDNIVCQWDGGYKWYQSHCPTWNGGNEHKLMKVASGHLLGRQEWANPMKVTSKDAGVPRGGDCGIT